MNIRTYLQKKKTPRILIIRHKPLGDTILTLPVFSALKNAFPESRTTIIISRNYSDIVRNNQNIDEVLEYNKGSFVLFLFRLLFRKFDVSIDYINSPRSSLVTLFSWARFRFGLHKPRNFFYNEKHKLIDHKDYMCEKNLGVLSYLGIENPPIQYDYVPGTEALNFVNEFMRNRNVTGKIIGLYVSGSAAIQKWPLKKFLELGKKLIEDLEVAVLIVWGPEDSGVIADISKDPLYSEKLLITPATSVDQMGAFIHRSSLFITGDGGPKHMSVALNIPTLTIYGGIDAKYWNPPDLKRFPIIISEIHCYPCGDKRSCRYQSYECLHSITVQDVQREVKRLAKEFI